MAIFSREGAFIDRQILSQSILEIVTRYMGDDRSGGAISGETPLIGTGSPCSSLQLVNILGRIEDFLYDEYDVDFEIVTREAFSRTNSPFASITRLAAYIHESVSDAGGCPKIGNRL